MVTLNTFSITARCQKTGQLGVAVSTKMPAVGMLCPFVRSNVGAIATQSFVNPYLGIWGLSALAEGCSADETLASLMDRDPGIAFRQLAIVDRHGGSVAFTGDNCDTWRGHLTGHNYAIAGNMLVSAATLDAMRNAFVSSEHLGLAQRLVQALSAGQEAGGDKRGRQSSALLVYGDEDYPVLDLRVDDHPDPVAELTRLYGVAERELLPFLSMLPTHANPEGTREAPPPRT